MHTESFDDGESFLARVGDYLAPHDIEHNLLLSIASGSEVADDRVRFAVFDEERVVGCAVQTPPKNLVLSRIDAADRVRAFDAIAAHLTGHAHAIPGVFGPHDVAAEFAVHWCAHRAMRAVVRMHSRVYELTRVIPCAAIPGTLIAARQEHLDRICQWAEAFVDDTGLPAADRGSRDLLARRIERGDFWLWADGADVHAMAAVAGTQDVPRIGFVYTPRALRGRGIASALVAALSDRLLAGGARRVSLNADVANPTSNKIYRAIGFVPLGECAMHEFV